MRIERVGVSVYEIPTDSHESDGTYEWDRTTLVLVEISAGGVAGLGFTYSHAAAAKLIDDKLRGLVEGALLEDTGALWMNLIRACRNIGHQGVAACAISAMDLALWDLKGKLLGLPVCDLLGRVRRSIPVYGSGGFTSYDPSRLRKQLSGWVDQGIRMVKMKVGRDPAADVERVRAVREAIGDDAVLMVDANGAHTPRAALRAAEAFSRFGVTWFEEPVSSDDLEGLAFVRERAPAGMSITAGEYGWGPWYFNQMVRSGAVDVLQVDITRCCGLTGLMKTAGLCEAAGVPMSTHTAPTAHVHAACSFHPFVHAEYFHDHVRIERMFFDGFPALEDGSIAPHPSRPGLGIELRRNEARRYAA